jgi:membrane protease YdiL (CAAX protease family)
MKKNLLQKLNTSSGGIAFSLMMVLFVMINFIGQAIVGAIFGMESVYFTVICSCFSVFTMFLVVGIFKFTTEEKFLSLTNLKPFKWYFSLLALALSAAMFFGVGFVNDTLVRAFEKLGVRLGGVDIPLDNFGQYVLFSVVLALLPAVFEEVFFRGLIIKCLEGVKPLYTVIAVALCFSLYHCSAAQLVYQLIYGALLTLLALTAKSSIPSMIAHFINNFAVITLEYFNVSVNLYNLAGIILGSLSLGAITALLILLLKNGQKIVKKDGDTNKISSFYIFASLGIFTCLLMMVGSIIMSLIGGAV